MPYKSFDNQYGNIYHKREIFNNAAAATEYQFRMNFFHGELSTLFCKLYVMERIHRWPWELFGTFYGGPRFLKTTYFGYWDSVITSLHRLGTDSNQSYTLDNFRQAMMGRLVKDRFRETLRRRLAEVKFEPQTKHTEKKVETLRHTVVAHSKEHLPHLVKDQSTAELPPIVRLSELRGLCEAMEAFYQAFNFGITANEVPVQYRRPIFKTPSHDFGTYELSSEVDELLKTFAKSSGVWGLPDDNPIALHQYSNEQIDRLNSFRVELGEDEIRLDQEDIDEINERREMFGLPKFRALWRETPQ